MADNRRGMMMADKRTRADLLKMIQKLGKENLILMKGVSEKTRELEHAGRVNKDLDSTIQEMKKEKAVVCAAVIQRLRVRHNVGPTTDMDTWGNSIPTKKEKRSGGILFLRYLIELLG